MRSNIITFLLMLFFVACNSKPEDKQANISKLSWQEIADKSKGATVTMMMYQGDKKANKYMSEYVLPAVKAQYGITLKVVAGQGKEIVNNIMAEKESNTTKGQIDICWINGETFYQLKQINGLYGSFVQQLPNSKYIDFTDPMIKYDFQQEVNGYEVPWGNAFFVAVTDTARVKKVPISMQDFEVYWQQNPGKFAIAQDFSGLTLLKSWLIELAGGTDVLDGAFNEKKYIVYSTQLWQFINKNKKNFWKRGETFPASNVAISQMFGNGEIDFTVAFGLADVDRKVIEGVYPSTAKEYILKAGCTHNTNYLGIPFNSANKEAAMAVCNFLISPDAQIKKCDFTVWGGSLVLDYSKLDKQWQTAYKALPKLKYGIADAEVKAKSIKETDPKYMLRVGEDFRKFVINAK